MLVIIQHRCQSRSNPTTEVFRSLVKALFLRAFHIAYDKFTPMQLDLLSFHTKKPGHLNICHPALYGHHYHGISLKKIYRKFKLLLILVLMYMSCFELVNWFTIKRTNKTVFWISAFVSHSLILLFFHNAFLSAFSTICSFEFRFPPKLLYLHTNTKKYLNMIINFQEI